MKLIHTKANTIFVITLFLSPVIFTSFWMRVEAQEPLLILSDNLFTALEPGGPVEFDRILAAQNPDWGTFQQEVKGEGLWTAGEIFASFAWGYELGTGVNTAVILVTYGVDQGWELPPDENLIRAVEQIRAALHEHESEWLLGRVDHSQYPHLANASTYALYRYFNGDTKKLDEWSSSFEMVFFMAPHQPFMKALSLERIDAVKPFIQRPFDQRKNPFYHVTSFFDHHYPLYSKEGERTDLYRFDGFFYDNIPEPDKCGYGGDTGSGTYCYSGHPAYDYSVMEDVPVRAVASGSLILCEKRWGALFIRHDNGLVTSYLHMDPLVIPDNIPCQRVSIERPRVEQGQVIGRVSNKAPRDMGIHLHFGVGYEADIAERQNIDPFGWWGSEPDPWENYQGAETNGLQSKWLWLGDEAGDGYLTVDNMETQAHLFNAPYSGGDWHHLDTGYQNDSWWATLSYQPTRTAVYWGIWGANIEQPGVYEVQAYWPADPEPQKDPVPASKVVYELYYHDINGNVRASKVYANQSRDANGFVTLCSVPYENQPEGCPEYARIQFGAGPSVVILRDSSDEPVERGKFMVFFDAIRWKKYSPPTPTVTPSPTTVPGQTIRVSITQNSDDAGTAPGTCAFSHPNNEVYFGACANGGDITSGFRFNNIQIPRDAIIEDACITFSVDGEYTAPINVNIYGGASSNPPTFSSTNTPAQRLLTSAFVSWNITDRWILGEKRNTPNLSMLVQEIVNRGDWNAGNSLAVIFKNAGSGSAHRRVIAIERASWDPNLHPAELVVTYRIGSTPTATPGSGTPGGATPTPPPPTPTTATLPPTATPQPCFCSLICPQSSSPAALRIQEQETPTPIPTPIPSDSSSRSFVQAVSDASELATLLYRVRDEVMSQSAEGIRLTGLFYAYAPNLAQVFIAEPALYDEGVLIIKSFVPGLQAMLDGNGDTVLITENQVTNMQAFLDELMELGDPDLQSVIQAELARRPLQSMIGMTMNDAWVYLNGYELTWLPPISNANPYLVQSGRAIPLAFTMVDAHGNFVVDETIKLQLVDSAGNVVIGPVGLGSNPANGILIQGGKYHYNLRTKSLPAGRYTLQVFYNVNVQSEPAIWMLQVKAK